MNREQCKGCAYFLDGGGGSKKGGYKFCHYMLFTGKRRAVGDCEECLSRSETKAKKHPAFVIPVQQN